MIVLVVAVVFALAGLALLRWTQASIAAGICIGGALALAAFYARKVGLL